MTILIALTAALVVGLLLLHVFLNTPPSELARRLRMGGGVALLLIAAVLLFGRRPFSAMFAASMGLFILKRHAVRRSGEGPGRSSSVRSAGLEMVLNHDTGEMDGRVLAGRHEGAKLSELTLMELLAVAEDFRGDAESLRLLEGYLDRTHPAWREDVEADARERQSAAPRAGGMSAQEAYEILGLEQGAGEADVREAHRRLMKQVHPDRGGSAALAAKINEAKDRILGRHR